MADTAPKVSNKKLYDAFYAFFQATRADLEVRLDALKASKTDAQVQAITQDVAKLRRSLVDNTALLPSYDKRQCELQMGQLEAALDSLRPAAAAKPKFAFKRKAAAPKAAPAPVTPPKQVEVKSISTTFRTLSNRSSAKLTWSDVPPSHSSQHDLTIADLDHCILDLLPHNGTEEKLTALHIRDIRDSVLLLPEVPGSILLLNMYRSVLVVGCHQYRMHSSKNVRVFLNVSSDPVIEHCSSIAFAAYPPSLLCPSTDSQTVTASKHTNIQDFSHIRATPSPNWRLLDESELPQWEALRNSLEADTVQSGLGLALSWTCE